MKYGKNPTREQRKLMQNRKIIPKGVREDGQ